MDNTKKVTVTHEIINFKVPAKLKADFMWACAKDERTASQQLRVLMVEYVASQSDEIASKTEILEAEKNISNYTKTKNVKINKHFTRGK